MSKSLDGLWHYLDNWVSHVINEADIMHDIGLEDEASELYSQAFGLEDVQLHIIAMYNDNQQSMLRGIAQIRNDYP